MVAHWTSAKLDSNMTEHWCEGDTSGWSTCCIFFFSAVNWLFSSVMWQISLSNGSSPHSMLLLIYFAGNMGLMLWIPNLMLNMSDLLYILLLQCWKETTAELHLIMCDWNRKWLGSQLHNHDIIISLHSTTQWCAGLFFSILYKQQHWPFPYIYSSIVESNYQHPNLTCFFTFCSKPMKTPSIGSNVTDILINLRNSSSSPLLINSGRVLFISEHSIWASIQEYKCGLWM